MRFLSKALAPAVVMIAFGLALLIVSVTFDHYALHRAQWYLGEIGLGAITLGTILCFFAVIAELFYEREPPNGGAH